MKTLKIYIITIILAGTSMLCKAQESTITYLDADNFQIRYKSEVFAILLDVSLKREYRRAHIPGAVLLNKMKKLEAFADTLDREIPIYIYCDGESRSLTVAEYLQENDFRKLYILRGGMRYWKDAGLPIETKKKFKLSFRKK